MIDLIENILHTDEKDRYGNMFNILRSNYTKAKKPLKCTLELTSRCTLDCKMCYVHYNDFNTSKLLSGDEWIKIIDDAVDCGVLYAVLTGGECFFHPEFRRIYTHLKERGVIIHILTNGTLIDEDTVKWLKKMPPHLIRISVYGSSPKVYEKVTGNASAFYKVDKALSLLKDAGIRTDISLTISKYNFDDLENLLAYVDTKSHTLTNIDCDLFEADENTNHNFNDFSLTYEEQEIVWETLFKKMGYKFRPTNKSDFSFLHTKKLINPEIDSKIPCVAGRCSFQITSSGIMQPCTEFPLKQVDVLKSGFINAWQEIYSATEKYRRSEECLNCVYFGNCRFCPARYSKSTGGKNGLPGTKPCNKSLLVLPEVIRKKYQ